MTPQHIEYTIRLATVHDAATIARHRAAMFLDMREVSAEQAAILRAESEPWLAGLLARGDYLGWVCEQGSAIVAGAGILIQEVGPRPGCYRTGPAAHVVNVYTEPSHRRRGLARRLMLTILDWCRDHEMFQVTLAASDEGRPLYESLGFEATNDMRLSPVQLRL
jgi:GNAT superfamily N-acetyltransferase